MIQAEQSYPLPGVEAADGPSPPQSFSPSNVYVSPVSMSPIMPGSPGNYSPNVMIPSFAQQASVFPRVPGYMQPMLPRHVHSQSLHQVPLGPNMQHMTMPHVPHYSNYGPMPNSMPSIQQLPNRQLLTPGDNRLSNSSEIVRRRDGSFEC